jgi:hypothetical protein
MQDEIEETTVSDPDTDNTELAPEVDAQEEEKFISQKELDRILQKRLKRQEEQLLKKYSDYEDRVAESESFRKMQDEKSTDAQRWEKERDKLVASLQERDEKLTQLERSNLIADLASEKGLPKSFWKRVQGQSEEEIAEDMESIIKDLGLKEALGEGKATPARPRKEAVYGGGGVTEDPEPDTDAIVARIPRGPQIRVEKPRSYK